MTIHLDRSQIVQGDEVDQPVNRVDGVPCVRALPRAAIVASGIRFDVRVVLQPENGCCVEDRLGVTLSPPPAA
jgi:hypothetical protein